MGRIIKMKLKSLEEGQIRIGRAVSLASTATRKEQIVEQVNYYNRTWIL